jgi:hypothetical protein
MTQHEQGRRRLLWTAAGGMGVLLALHAISGAPPVGSSGSAHAGMVSRTGQHTILAADASNEDVLLVLDGRSEELLVYRTDVNKGIQLFQRLSLPDVFTDAKTRATGR